VIDRTFRPAALAAAALLALLPATASPADADPRTDAAPSFPAGTTGAFSSLDLATGARFRVNPAACTVRHSPFSTFKIPNGLIGLSTGVVTDPRERWHWDRTRYPPPSWSPGGDYLAVWQHDQSLETALARSIVWYFQELATRVGEARMRQWLATFAYGNQDTSGGLDRFWLRSTLAISADEQVDFLARLSRGEAGVSPAHLATLKDLLVQDRGEGSRLAAKTGSGSVGQGWLVGWVDRPGGGCTFALHLRSSSFAEMARIRHGLARAFLRRAGCLPE
jgi:beta-lactamase class D